MSEEAIVERGDVPIARAASPLWKWAFIGTMLTLGAGALAALVLSELQGPAVPEAEEDHKPRLRFNVGIPILMSAVSFGVESYAREQLTSDQADYIEGAINDTLSGVLAEFAKIKPTLHKNQGDPINIVVARDVDLSSVYALRRSGHGR